MNTDIVKEAEDRVLAIYCKKAGLQSAPVGFDPTIILTILTTILSMCPLAPKELKKTAKAKGLQARLMVGAQVRRELRQRYGLFAFGKYNGDAICETCFEAASESSEDEIAAFSEACGVG